MGSVSYISLRIDFRGDETGICSATMETIGYAFPCLEKKLANYTKSPSFSMYESAEFDLGLLANTRDGERSFSGLSRNLS